MAWGIAWWKRWVQRERELIRAQIEADRYPERPPIPMSEWLASLPPSPPMFEPEPPDPTWKDDRDD
jgi:hypothetical protein